jgi:hypothetical protein
MNTFRTSRVVRKCLTVRHDASERCRLSRVQRRVVRQMIADGEIMTPTRSASGRGWWRAARFFPTMKLRDIALRSA